MKVKINNKRELSELTNEELLEISDLFVSIPHSDNWKIGEAKDLMNDYYIHFIEVPKDNWKEDIIKYLTDRNFKLPKNRLFK